MPGKKLLVPVLGGITAGTLVGLVVARAIDRRRMDRTWHALEVAEDGEVFSEELVRDLPETVQRYFRHGISTLEKVVAMLAVSTCLIEKLLGRVRELGATPTLVTGISLGGFVANRHHARYNGADCYAPVLAAAAMGDIFVNSIYRRGVARRARENPQVVKAALDFQEEYAAVDHSNVYPVLARHDQIVLYQCQKSCYGEQPILTLEKGHVTGAVAYRELRRHILSLLPAEGQRCQG